MNNVATAIGAKSLPDPYTIPLDQIDVSDPELYRSDRMWSYFARLRREDPVHYCAESPFGAFWSVTKYNDIMYVETHHGVFSSDASLGGGDIARRQCGPLSADVHRDGPAQAR